MKGGKLKHSEVLLCALLRVEGRILLATSAPTTDSVLTPGPRFPKPEHEKEKRSSCLGRDPGPGLREGDGQGKLCPEPMSDLQAVLPE